MTENFREAREDAATSGREDANAVSRAEVLEWDGKTADVDAREGAYEIVVRQFGEKAWPAWREEWEHAFRTRLTARRVAMDRGEE